MERGRGEAFSGVLYEEFFHCKDLGAELGPIIKRFMAKEEALKSAAPVDSPAEASDGPIMSDPAAPDFGRPFPLEEWISQSIRQGVGQQHVLWRGVEKVVALQVALMKQAAAPTYSVLFCFSGHSRLTSRCMGTGRRRTRFPRKRPKERRGSPLAATGLCVRRDYGSYSGSFRRRHDARQRRRDAREAHPGVLLRSCHLKIARAALTKYAPAPSAQLPGDGVGATISVQNLARQGGAEGAAILK